MTGRVEGFEEQWPRVARDLRRLLLARGAKACDADDIIQETALRLLRRWDDVDQDRALFPLAATFALNLLRDDFRRRRREFVGTVEPTGNSADVELEGLARLELARVGAAISRLPEVQRKVLLATVEDFSDSPVFASDPSGASQGVSTAATKMRRMRARRRLTAILEASAVALTTLRLRIMDWSQPAHAAAVVGASAVLLTSALAPSPVEGRREFAAPPTPSSRVAVLNAVDGPVPLDADRKSASRALQAEPSSFEGLDLSAGGRSDPEPDSDIQGGIRLEPSGQSGVGLEAGPASVSVVQEGHGNLSLCTRVKLSDAQGSSCAATTIPKP